MVASSLEIGYRATTGTLPVAHVAFAIPDGRVAAVVGPNGAGKSTLIKTLAGLLPPLSGTITIHGLPNDAYRYRFGIGYLPEDVTLPEHWSGNGMLALAAIAGVPSASSHLAEALTLAGVDFDLSARIGDMGKGMRRRLALAMVVLPPPAVLLLDEPEAGLDPAQRVRLRERIRSFAQRGAIVLIASHDVTGTCTIADETYLLRRGHMEQVSQATLADPARVLQLFDGGVA